MSKDIRENWNKNAVIEFKNDKVALVQRKWGEQLEQILLNTKFFLEERKESSR